MFIQPSFLENRSVLISWRVATNKCMYVKHIPRHNNLRPTSLLITHAPDETVYISLLYFYKGYYCSLKLTFNKKRQSCAYCRALWSNATFRHTPHLSSKGTVGSGTGSGCSVPNRTIPYCTDPYRSVETSHNSGGVVKWFPKKVECSFNTYFPVYYCEAALTQSVLFKVFYKWMWLDFLMHLFKVVVFDALLQGWAIIRTFRPGLRSWRSSLRSCSREPSSTRWQRPRWPIALRGLWNLSQWWGIRGSYPSPWRWPLWSLVLNGWVLYVNYMI